MVQVRLDCALASTGTILSPNSPNAIVPATSSSTTVAAAYPARAFFGAIPLSDQRKYEKQMQLILLKDTPVILPYFYNYLAAGSKKVKGYKADAQGTMFLSHTSLA